MASQNSSKDLEAGKIVDGVVTNAHSSKQVLLNKEDVQYVTVQDFRSVKKKLRMRTIIGSIAVCAVVVLAVSVVFQVYHYEQKKQQNMSQTNRAGAQKPTTTTTETTRKYPIAGQRQQLKQDKLTSSTTELPGLTTRLKAKKLNCMELVADDGNRIVTVTPGHALSHWQTVIKKGGCSLEATMFIKVADSGIYNVYGQVAFYQNNATSHLDFKIVRNHDVIAKAIVDKCAHICTRYLSRLVSLRKGDYLSIQSSYKVKLYMRKKLTYFGIRQIA